MTARYAFTLADVFAEAPFGGNQLAVVLDARGLSDRAMQSIAREFNFPETTFVLPASSPSLSARVRIFTPRAELPFAGHPTVGTAAVLVDRGIVPRATGDDVVHLILEEGIGPVPVDVQPTAAGYSSRLSLPGKLDIPAHSAPLAELAAVLSISPSLVVESWFASAGLSFCFVRLDTREAVDAASLDRSAWKRTLEKAWSAQIYLFAGDPRAPEGATLYARMFAPTFGFEEDPATGSAAAALVGSIAARASGEDSDVHIRIEQGVALGRPSVIHASAERRNGTLTAIHVTGSTVIAGEGELRVPDGY